MALINLDFIIREDEATYRARKGCLTSHALADFRKCPLLYRKKQQGLITEEDTTAYLIGRALHTLVLEGREIFSATYAIGGPINPRTGEVYGSATKAFAEWAAVQGKPVLTSAQAQLIEQMAASVQQHTVARDLLTGGIAEGVVRIAYCGRMCQGRIDYIEPSSIIDLKSCDDLSYFEADARRFGYMHQLAFYRALVAAATGHKLPIFIIAIEKKEPYRCGVWLADKDSLDCAQRENEAAIGRLEQCEANDYWPTGYEDIRVLE